MSGKTPISILQELMVARGLPYPTYIDETVGMNFKSTVIADNVVATGISSSKKSAKHESAKNALIQLGYSFLSQKLIVNLSPPVLEEPQKSYVEGLNTFSSKKLVQYPKYDCVKITCNSPPTVLETPQKNYVGNLNEFASKKGIQYPEYDCFSNMICNGEFNCKCSFIGKEVVGKGLNKKDAKQNAAKKMLDLVKNIDSEMVVGDIYQTKVKPELTIPDRDKIVNLYKKLSLKTENCPKVNDFVEQRDIQIKSEDTVHDLKKKLELCKINFTLKELQRFPYVMLVAITGTDLKFIASDIDKEVATKKVFQDVLEVYKTGVPLNTNDLISLN